VSIFVYGRDQQKRERIEKQAIRDVTAKIERVFILIRRSWWMFRRFLRHKAIRNKGLLLILPKPPLCPRRHSGLLSVTSSLR